MDTDLGRGIVAVPATDSETLLIEQLVTSDDVPAATVVAWALEDAMDDPRLPFRGLHDSQPRRNLVTVPIAAHLVEDIHATSARWGVPMDTCVRAALLRASASGIKDRNTPPGVDVMGQVRRVLLAAVLALVAAGYLWVTAGPFVGAVTAAVATGFASRSLRQIPTSVGTRTRAGLVSYRRWN